MPWKRQKNGDSRWRLTHLRQTRGVFLCNLELVDYFILNEVEGRILAGTDSEEPAPILKALREKYKNAAFVLTLGDQGAWYCDPEETSFQDIFRVEAVDTTGGRRYVLRIFYCRDRRRPGP